MTCADEASGIGTNGNELEHIGMGTADDGGLACEVGLPRTCIEFTDGTSKATTEVGVGFDFVQPIIKNQDSSVVAHGGYSLVPVWRPLATKIRIIAA